MKRRRWSRAKAPNPYLYLYHHVPKSAGSTLIHHLDATLSPDESINLDVKLERKDDVRAHVLQAHPRLDRLRSVHGHRVFFGLHQIVDREPRYYTFLRNPVDRVVSLYNFFADHPARRELMHPGGELVPIQEFIETFSAHNVSVRFLYAAMEGEMSPGYAIEHPSDRHVAVASTFLDQCWFVGFVEDFDHDVACIAAAMGVAPPTVRRNASRPHFRIEDDPGVEKRILELNLPDVELYDYARGLR